MDLEILRKYRIHIAITIALIAGMFSYITLRCPLSAWIWPAALLFAVRLISVKRSIIVSTIVITITTFVGLIAPIRAGISVSIDYLFVFIIEIFMTSIIFALPFLIDRLFYGKIGTVRQLFVFPLMMSTVSYYMWKLPLSSSMSFVNSQTGFLWFTQGLSIYGMLGMVFILGLFATSVNLFIQTFPKRDREIRWTAICAVLIIAVMIFGGVRLATAENQETIRVLFSEGPLCVENEGISLEEQIEVFDRVFATALNQKAQMVVFYEESFYLEEEWVSSFETHVADRVRSSDIYLIYAGIVEENGNRYNTCTMVTPENGIEWRYDKTNLTPGVEKTITEGDGTLYYTDTPYGRVTTVICHDLNFHYFVNGIDKDADMLVAPSYDWKGLEGWNASNHSFRAIENGVCLIKATMDGTSSTYDRYGRLIDTYVSFDDGSLCTTHMVNASTEGCRTFYGEYGHVIDSAFVACAILMLLSCIYTYRHDNEKDQ